MALSQEITYYKYWGHIAEYDGNVAGVCLCKTTDDKEIEIHMLAVDKKYPRKGIATALINYEIGIYKKSIFIARCYKKSTWAMGLLKKLGFLHIKTSNMGTKTFSFKK